MKPFVIAAVAAAAITAAFVGLAPAPVANAATESAPCFLSREWKGTKAVDEHKLYLGVGQSSVYEVDFKQSCPNMDSPFTKFISIQRGTGAICSAMDIDLKVNTAPGQTTACLATGIRKLSDAEVAAIPKELRPN